MADRCRRFSLEAARSPWHSARQKRVVRPPACPCRWNRADSLFVRDRGASPVRSERHNLNRETEGSSVAGGGRRVSAGAVPLHSCRSAPGPGPLQARSGRQRRSPQPIGLRRQASGDRPEPLAFPTDRAGTGGPSAWGALDRSLCNHQRNTTAVTTNEADSDSMIHSSMCRACCVPSR